MKTRRLSNSKVTVNTDIASSAQSELSSRCLIRVMEIFMRHFTVLLMAANQEWRITDFRTFYINITKSVPSKDIWRLSRVASC